MKYVEFSEVKLIVNTIIRFPKRLKLRVISGIESSEVKLIVGKIIKFSLLLQPRQSFSPGSVFPAESSRANRCISLPKYLLIAILLWILTIEFSMDVMRISVLKYLIIAIVMMIQTIELSMDPEKRCLLVSWGGFLCQNTS